MSHRRRAGRSSWALRSGSTRGGGERGSIGGFFVSFCFARDVEYSRRLIVQARQYVVESGKAVDGVSFNRRASRHASSTYVFNSQFAVDALPLPCHCLVVCAPRCPAANMVEYPISKRTYARELGATVTALGDSATLLDVKQAKVTAGGLNNSGPVGASVVAVVIMSVPVHSIGCKVVVSKVLIRLRKTHGLRRR